MSKQRRVSDLTHSPDERLLALIAAAARCVVLGPLATLAIAGQATAALGVATAHPAAKHHLHTSCRSGRTEFRKGALRVFRVSSTDSQSGGARERLLMCSSASGKPRLLLDGGGDAELLPIRFAVQGRRLALEVQTVLFMNPVALAPTEVGWIDLRGGPARFGLLNVGTEAPYVTPDESLLPVEQVNYAIAPDGWMAVIGRAKSGCQVVAALATLRTRSADGHLLGVPDVLYTAPQGGLDPKSLKIDDATVTWRTIGGSPGSAPRSSGTPATGSPLAQTGGC